MRYIPNEKPRILRDAEARVAKTRAEAEADADAEQSRYGDADDWPILFMDYSETRDAWKSDVSKMRRRLRDAIANSAPLQVRADIVATTYGTPGEPDDDGDDD